MPRLKIGDTVYPEVGFDQIALKDMLIFDGQAADAGLTYRWTDIRTFSEAIEEIPEDERAWDTRAVFLGAVSMWLSIRASGEPMTFDEVISMPSSAYTWIPDPEDRKDPTKGATRPRKASAPARLKAAEGPGSSVIPEPSESPSIPA